MIISLLVYGLLGYFGILAFLVKKFACWVLPLMITSMILVYPSIFGYINIENLLSRDRKLLDNICERMSRNEAIELLNKRTQSVIFIICICILNLALSWFSLFRNDLNEYMVPLIFSLALGTFEYNDRSESRKIQSMFCFYLTFFFLYKISSPSISLNLKFIICK